MNDTERRKADLARRREASLKGQAARAERLKQEAAETATAQEAAMRASAYFFYTHGDDAVKLIPAHITVEQMYQAFKTRLRAEQEQE